MVAVAIVGVAIGAEAMRRRRITLLNQADRWAACTNVFVERATKHEANAKMSADLARDFEHAIKGLERSFGRPVTEFRELAKAIRDRADEDTRSAPRQRELAARADALVSKYKRAARHPWLPVAPDRFPWPPVAPDPPEPR